MVGIEMPGRASRPDLVPQRQKFVHLGRGPELFDPSHDGVALSSARKLGKLALEPELLLLQALLKRVGF
jgi:hypothetical protein